MPPFEAKGTVRSRTFYDICVPWTKANFSIVKGPALTKKWQNDYIEHHFDDNGKMLSLYFLYQEGQQLSF